MGRTKRSKLFRIIPFLLFYSGLFWCWRYYNKNKITMLMVHGVVDFRANQKWIPLWGRVDTEHFESVVELLSGYYNFVSLDDAVDMLAGQKEIKPYSMVITFDDGYRNNLKYAQPILEKYNIPAVIFLATGFIGNRKPFWIDRLDYALQSAEVDKRKFLVGNKQVMIHSSRRSKFKKSFTNLRLTAKAAKRNDHEMLYELESLSDKLEKESGKRLLDIFDGDDWSGILSWEDIKDSLAKEISYGAHTVDHARLEFVDMDEARKQVKLSKDDIEKALGKPCDHFCYPNGSFNNEIIEIVKNCDFKSALTSTAGLNAVGDNLLTLKRVPFPDCKTKSRILSDVTGLTGLLATIFLKVFGR